MPEGRDCDNCGGQGVDPGDDGTGTFMCTICGGSGIETEEEE